MIMQAGICGPKLVPIRILHVAKSGGKILPPDKVAQKQKGDDQKLLAIRWLTRYFSTAI